MSASEWVTVFSCIGAVILSLVGGTWILSMYISDIKVLIGDKASKEDLGEKVKERNHVIDRVYERMDELKRNASESYIRKDMCAQLHSSSKDEIRRIEEDNKNSRHELLNIIQKINLTLEAYNDKFAELRELILKK